jgi:predicted DNA-binding transcriptional regulator YafY
MLPPMRASRLVSILLLLQSRGRMTAHELAGVLEVSTRTVYRDIESLAAAGVPVYGETGWDGGYRLVDGYRTQLTGLTDAEAESLFLVGLPKPAADLGLGAAAEAAQRKLMAALSAEQRDHAAGLNQRFHLDVPAWYDDACPHPALAAIADAVWAQRRMRIRYLRWQPPREITRTLDPFGLVLKAGRWYLVARHSRQVRTYRISNVLSVRPLGQHFARPDDFDLACFWQHYLDDYYTRRYHDHAVVRFSPRALELLADFLEPAVVRAAHETARPRDDDGWTEVTIPIESVDQALPELLKFGAQVEVRSPPALRDRLVHTLGALSALYRQSPATDSRC